MQAALQAGHSQGLANVAAAQTHPLYTSFDDMPVFDRNLIMRQINSTKRTTGTNFVDWDWQNVWKPQITSTFNDQIKSDIQTYRANAENERKIKEEQDRIKGNQIWDTKPQFEKDQQPTERWTGKNIGFKAYKWLRNFKSTNGNWYAEYQPVRGGENRKFYNLALDKEAEDAYVMSLQCQACNHTFRGIAPQLGNVCPQCGAQSDRLRYRGRYS